jgi:hypothetical protein
MQSGYIIDSVLASAMLRIFMAERGGESGEPMSIDLATTGYHQY